MTDRELLELVAQKVVKIDGEIVEIKTDLAQVKSDIVQMKGEIVEIKSDIVQMKGEIVEIKSDIVQMKGEIVEIKSDIVQMKGEIVVIKDDIVEMKGDIKDLQQKQDVIMEQTAGLTEFRASASVAIENGNDSLEFWKARHIALEEEVFRLKKKIS